MYGVSNCSSLGFTKKRWKSAGRNAGENERAAEDHGRRNDGKSGCAQPHVGPRDDGSGGSKTDEQPENWQLNVDIGVACPDHDAIVIVEQQEAVQRIGPSLHREIETQQGGAMCDSGGRNVPRSAVQIDFAVHEIHRSGDESAQDQDHQHPVLERDVDRQREEVEANVPVKQRIILAVRHLVDEPEDQVPLTGLANRDQQSDHERNGKNDQMPLQQRRHKRKQIGRCPRQCPDSREVCGGHCRKPKPSPRRKPNRQRSVHPEKQGGYCEYGHEEERFRGENRPEDADIADRREPRPIDHQVAGTPQHYEAGHDDGNRHADACPGHVPSPVARSTRWTDSKRCFDERPGLRPSLNRRQLRVWAADWCRSPMNL
jgi:hypothetical protein